MTRLALAIEYFIVTRFLRAGVNPVMRPLFRLPIIFYRLGLGNWLGNQVLLLTTTGRRTGKPRVTALTFSYDVSSGTYTVMTGWGGKSDWLRNALANPRIHVRVGAREFDGIAQLLPLAQSVTMMRDFVRRNPRAPKMWSQLSGIPFDGTDESMRQLAAYFPSLILAPSNFDLTSKM